MKSSKVFKKVIAAVSSVTMMLSCLAMPIFSTRVLADGDSEQTQVGSIEDVTNLQWVSGSSATISWYASENANYYAVTVTVYQSDGITVIGSAETGTTATQLDVQQEINGVIQDSGFDSVKITATVYAQTLEDGNLVAQSTGITSSLWDYSSDKTRLPTPTNLTLSDDLVLSFDYSGDNPSANVSYINIQVMASNGYYSFGTQLFPAASDWKNGKCTTSISQAIENCIKSYSIEDTVDVKCNISLVSNTASYSDSAWSDDSNAIDYESNSNALPTPTNVTLGNDLKLSFDYGSSNPSAYVSYVNVQVFVNGNSYGTSVDPVASDWKDGKCIISISDAVKECCKSYAITGDSSVYCTVSLVSNNASYTDSAWSDDSNTIDYESKLTVLPTPSNVALSEDLILSFNCGSDDPSENVQYLCVHIITDHGDLSTFVFPDKSNWEDGKCSISIGDPIAECYKFNSCSGVVNVKCEVSLWSDSEEYANGAVSAESNTIEFNGQLPVSSLTLSPETPMICQGNSYYIGKTISPVGAYYNKIEWSSDNTNIVKVDQNGKITGVNVGTANVTARIGKVTATVPVTVYTISSNVDNAADKAEVIDVAGDIIDDIANNDNPDLSNTDIDASDVADLKNDVQNGILNGDAFYTDVVAEQQDFGSYGSEWTQIQAVTGNSNAQYVGAYDIEVEMYHEDKSGKETHIGDITEFDTDISFTCNLPSEMKTASGNKEYVLVRVHTNTDGTVEYSLVDYTINSDGTFTASSDKYSGFVWCSIDSNKAIGPVPQLTSGIAHVQDIGDVSYTVDSAAGILTIGTRGMGKRLEEITINWKNTTPYSGTLKYRVHVQDYGWMEWVPAGTKCGTEGEAKRIEAIEICFTGEISNYYSVVYCVHIQDYGDMQGWVKDGALAGTTGESKRIEELKIKIVPKHTGSSMSVKYRVHVQDYGWEGAYASNGKMAGTSGESKRLEGIEIFLDGTQYSGGIKYKTHVQNIGWESGYSKDGEMSGTQGMSYRLEGICIELYGEVAQYYDVYYRVHAQDIGWMGWAKNGECAGTAGRSARLEGIQIVLVPKGNPAPGATYEGITSVTNKAFIEGF